MLMTEQKEYMTFEEASEYVGLKRSMLYNRVKKMGIQTHTFPMDRRAYLKMSDVERNKEVKEKPWLMGGKEA